MKYNYSFSLLQLPLVILLILAVSLFVERSGIKYNVNDSAMQILPFEKVEVEDYFSDAPVSTLLLYDSNSFTTDHVKTVRYALDSMRVKYDAVDVSSGREYDLSKYTTVVVSFIDLENQKDQVFALVDWVRTGGRVLFTIRPDPSPVFNGIYRKLGIISKSDGLIVAKGVEFVSDLLPGAKGKKLGADFIASNSYFFQLDENCKIHLKSADDFKTPILWQCVYDEGLFVVINSDQFNTKSDRGVIGAGYSLLDDVFVYPVINSSVYFIDEFPGPIKSGSDDFIARQYGRDIQNFFINVWWPDVQQLSREYNVKYTGNFIETYNDNIIPPFNRQPENEEYQYFGGLLLDDGGEIGLNGYNHVPFCSSDAGVNQQLDYPVWPSQETMELSIYESFSFTKSLFPGNKITTYVPPSNVLCPDARRFLPQILPDLQVISSLYLPGEAGLAYEQEFSEAQDGVIELPRVVGGYELTSYFWWAAINELSLHYVNSYYLSPTDVLTDASHSQKGWEYLYGQFEGYVKWLTTSAPNLQNKTALDGAMAVQRFSRLATKTEQVNGGLEISLGNFYDEAWLMMRTTKEPESIVGGDITLVTTDLYLIHAQTPKIFIYFKE